MKNKRKNTMKNNELNKYNIEITLLKKLFVAKKDFNKVTAIKYDNNLNIQIPVYQYKKPSYTFKHTIKPFAKMKTFRESFPPPKDAKISSIYKNYQNNYRTKSVERFISKFSKEDKQ